MSINPPLLFGVDPDETWRYVPKAARAAKLVLPAVTLRAPSLAAAVEREALAAERRRATIALDPNVLNELDALTGGTYKIEPPPTEETEETLKAYVEKVRAFALLNLRWAEASEKVAPEFKARQDASDLRILNESIAGWEGLPTASGRLIEFEKAKGRIGEVFRGALRDELVEAAMAGTFVSEEDAVGLQSSPASQAA